MALKTVGFEPVQLYAAPAYGNPGTPFRITNLDFSNTAFLGPDITLTQDSSPLRSQGTITYDGNRDVWASTLTQGLTVACDVDPNSLTWDSPLQIAESIAGMGIAPLIDGVNSTLYKAPGVTATTILFNMPPLTPAARLWSVQLSASVSASVSQGASAQLVHNASDVLAELDFQPPASGLPQYDSIYIPFSGGFLLQSGAQLRLVLTTFASLSWLASAFANVSIP